MAPSTKPTLTVSTATHIPGDPIPILPGLGEPYVSRAIHEMERAHPNVKPIAIVSFTAYTPPTWDCAAKRFSAVEQFNAQQAESLRKLRGEQPDLDARSQPAMGCPWVLDEEVMRAIRVAFEEKALRDAGTRRLHALLFQWTVEENLEPEAIAERLEAVRREEEEGKCAEMEDLAMGMAESVLREDDEDGEEADESVEMGLVDSGVEMKWDEEWNVARASWWETMSAAQVGGMFEEVEMVAGNATA